MEVLAKRLKWLREKERLSQKEVAAKIGMTVSGYQKIEYGERDPKLDVLIKLAELYDVSTDFLLGISDRDKFLNETSREIIAYREILKRKKMELLISSHNLKQAQKEYERLKEETITKENEDYFKYRELYVKYVNSKKKGLEVEFYSIQNIYTNKMLDYIKVLINLPEAKPWEDDIIKSITPINIEIQIETPNKYSLLLFGKDEVIGLYDQFESFEAAQRKKDELSKLLNGE
jgi:transcriptional regulator with XRE-family HTH domain